MNCSLFNSMLFTFANTNIFIGKPSIFKSSNYSLIVLILIYGISFLFYLY